MHSTPTGERIGTSGGRTALAAATVLALTIAAIAVAGPDDFLRRGETVSEAWAAFPGTEPLDDDGDPTILVVRVVDAETDEPIPGARIQIPDHPKQGIPQAELHHAVEAITDWDGWVRVPARPFDVGNRDYTIADAPGYAANEYAGDDFPQLRRGVDLPVLVVDATGEPVPYAHVELQLGCEHIPAQRAATADGNGRLTLESVAPDRLRDYFVAAPGLHAGSNGLRGEYHAGGDHVILDAWPGVTVEGRVLRADNTPVARVAIGPRDESRPWTRTDDDGRFRIVGVSPYEKIAVRLQGGAADRGPWFHAPPEGVARLFRIGAPVAGVALTVSVVDEDGGPAEGVRVVLVRAKDGLTAPSTTDPRGRSEFSLPHGDYRVVVDGELGAFGRAETAITLRENASTSAAERISVTVPRNPTIRVDASRVLGLTVGIVTPQPWRRLDPEEIDGQLVPVPPTGAYERTRFRISGRESGELVVHYVDIPRAADRGDDPLVIDWAPVTRLRAHLTDADGEGEPGWLLVRRVLRSGLLATIEEAVGDRDEPDESGPIATETRLTGRVDWVACPCDGAYAPIEGTARIPPGGGEIDLGELRLERAAPPSELTVDVPPEWMGADEWVYVFDHEGWERARVALAADGGGSIELPGVLAGSRIRLELDDPEASGVRNLPLRHVLSGPSPSTIRWPRATLTVRPLDWADADERPLREAVVLVDGVALSEPNAQTGAFTFRGLTPGPHTVVVAERDHIAKVYRLQIRDGEQRSIDVDLRER